MPGLFHAPLHTADIARGEDALESRRVAVFEFRKSGLLRQIADATRPGEVARCRIAQSRQSAQQRRLAGTVLPDEADLVTGVKRKGCIRDESPNPCLDDEVRAMIIDAPAQRSVARTGRASQMVGSWPHLEGRSGPSG